MSEDAATKFNPSYVFSPITGASGVSLSGAEKTVIQQIKEVQKEQAGDIELLKEKLQQTVDRGKTEIQNETNKLKEQISKIKEEVKRDIEGYRDEVKRIDRFNTGVTIAVMIAFLTTMSLVFYDFIKEKDLYLRYNDLYKNYSDKSSDLSNEINKQRIETNNLMNQIETTELKSELLEVKSNK